MAAARLPVFQRNKTFKVDIEFGLAFRKALVTLHPESEIVKTLTYTARNAFAGRDEARSKDKGSELLDLARKVVDDVNTEEQDFPSAHTDMASSPRAWSIMCIGSTTDYINCDLQQELKKARDVEGNTAGWNMDVFELSSELYRTHNQRQERCKILNEVDTGDGVYEPLFRELHAISRIFQDEPPRKYTTHFTVLLERCGLHIHVGVDRLPLDALKMLALITIVYEDAISELHPLHRRPARAGKSGTVETNRVAFFRLPEAMNSEDDRNLHGTTALNETLTLPEIEYYINSQPTVSDLVDIMSAGGHKSLVDWRHVRSVNDTSPKTIIFRQHQSTFDVEHILHQIQFCERLVRVAELYHLRGEGCGIGDKAWATGKISLDNLFDDMLLDPQAVQHFKALQEKYRPAAEDEVKMYTLFDPGYAAAQEKARSKRETKDREVQDALPPVHLTPCNIDAHSLLMDGHWNEIAPGEMCPEALIEQHHIFYIKYHSMRHWDVLDPILDDIVPRTRSIAAVLDSLRYQYPNDYQDLVDRHRREDLMREYAARVWHDAYDVEEAMMRKQDLLMYWLSNLCNGLYGVEAYGNKNFMLVICEKESWMEASRDQAWRVNDYTAFCRNVYIQASPLWGVGTDERDWKAMKRKGWTAPAVTTNYKPRALNSKVIRAGKDPLRSPGHAEDTDQDTNGDTTRNVSEHLDIPEPATIISHEPQQGVAIQSNTNGITPYSRDFPDVTISAAGVLGVEEHAIASEYAIFVNYHSMSTWKIIDVPSRNANQEGNLCGLYAIRTSLKHQYPAEWPAIEKEWSEDSVLQLMRAPTVEQRSSWLPGAELHHDNFSELQLGMAVALMSPQPNSGNDAPPFRLVVCTKRFCPSRDELVDRACRVAYDPNRFARNVYIYHKVSNSTNKYWTLKKEPAYNHWQAMKRLATHELKDISTTG